MLTKTREAAGRREKMQTFSGKSVNQGIAIGPAVVLKKADEQVKPVRIADADAEIARINKGLSASQEQLRHLYEKAEAEVGKEHAAIFQAHRMILEDEEFLSAVRETIRREQVGAEYAAAVVGDRFARTFAEMDDDYMRARAADIRDVVSRLIRNLNGTVQADFSVTQPSVIVADDLSPSETMQMDREKILALVTVHGSANSHTAILARTMNIPALVGVPLDLRQIQDGTMVLVDGAAGVAVFDPTAEAIQKAQEKIAKEQEVSGLLLELRGKENITRGGKKIEVYANISGPEDVARALENDAGGIGLFRSEFLYLGRESLPTEEEQLQAYRQVLRAMGEKKVIIRTLDIGADKKADYLHLEREENPALGCRAIRFCLTRPDIFKTQLRALLRAAVYGNLSVLYPMIISADEVRRVYGLVSEAKQELDAREIPCRVPEQGVMIETPAAVMISEELAELADFFSIGTNDLTQYTLAVDRRSEKLSGFCNPHHPAVLRMIRMAAQNAHKHGKRVGICGELGADPELTEAFLDMGIDELSVPPSQILPLRKRIREIP